MSNAMRLIWGPVLAALLACAATAEPGLRPVSRDEGPRLADQAGHDRLASLRPAARPAWMLRHPVTVNAGPPPVRPPLRAGYLPEARWDFRRDARLWTRAAMSALAAHGRGLETVVPRDIETWCPGYAANPPPLRRAFWVGMMSALAKHESTWRPHAVGGGGLWYGLLQIYPDTARRYGCRARTGRALTDPEDNLSCAVRIMAVTVGRDRAVALNDGRWRGVAADWGPMTDRAKIAEMAAWTRARPYCEITAAVTASPRPRMRPGPVFAEAARPRPHPETGARLSTRGE